MAEKVEIIITAKDNASKAIKSLEQSSKALFNTFAKGAAVGMGALAAGLAASIPLALDAELAQRNLAQTIESTGGVAGVTAKEANYLADSLANVTRFSDEQIISAESMLLTFTKIGEDVFPQATETVLNMAEKFGGLESASIQLGKALNDPVTGVGALREVGVSFTEDQQKMIESLVETGDIAGAQKIILDELGTEVGGLARAYGDTAAGKLARFKNRMVDVAQAIGGRLIGPIGDAADAIGQLILYMVDFGFHSSEAFESFQNLFGQELGAQLYHLAEPIALIADRVANLVRVFFESGPLTLEFAKALGYLFASYDVGNAFLAMIGPIQSFVDIVRDFISEHSDLFVRVFRDLGVILGSGVILGALLSIGGALLGLLNPVTLVIAGVVALVTAYETNFLGMKDAVDAFVKWFIKDAMPVVKKFIVNDAIPVLKDLFEEVKTGWETIKPLLELFRVWFLEDALPDIKDYIVNDAIPALENFIDWLSRVWIDVKPHLQELALWFLDSALPAIIDFITSPVIPTIRDFIETLINVWEWTRPKLQALYNWFVSSGMPMIRNIITNIVIPAFQSLTSAIQQVYDWGYPKLQSFYNWVMNAFNTLRTSVLQPLVNTFNEVVNAINNVINAIGRVDFGLLEDVGNFFGGVGKKLGIPGAATGGFRSGLFETGELGSEYVYAPGGAMVLPADLTAALKGLGNNYSLTVNNPISQDNVINDFRFMEALASG